MNRLIQAAVQFLIGGVIVTFVSQLANMKNESLSALAGLLATLPVQDMIPYLFITNKADATLYAVNNALANVGVVAAMSAVAVMSSLKFGSKLSFSLGLCVWFAVALLLMVISHFIR